MTPSVQMRTTTNANMRQEPSGKAAIAAVVQAGAIVHADPTRSTDGWIQVQIVNGWISGELLERVE